MDHVPRESVDSTEAVDGAHLARLAAGEEMSVQHFTIEPGASVPEHSHRHEQAGYIADGTLTFLLADGEEVVCAAGDSYVLDGEEVHGAENRGDVPVTGIDVFSPPRTDPDWTD